MTEQQLARINELAKKSRTPQGLTAEEKAEQQSLRQAYLQAVRSNVRQQLEAMEVKEADGTVHPLRPGKQ